MKKKIICILPLAAYSAFVLIMVLNHEYWFDEAQAWNIARDNDIAGIFGMVKYEGHPPLWHLILKIFTALNCSWRMLGLISWGMATATAAVIIFALPIKPYLKAALLLSSGMLYINTVISRVYVLIMLLLAVTAAVYPNRKKHPAVFGLLVALLANTHICMCGLVGIIGIFMLIDYFKDFKSNSAKQNMMNTFGLLIAGAGVIVLIVPMLDSFSTNYIAASRRYTLSDVAKSFAGAFSEIVGSGCAPDLPALISLIFSVTVQILLVGMYIFIRKNRRAFAIELVYTLFYLVLTEVIWYTTPNRGALFLFSLVMIYAMCRDEPLAEGRKSGMEKAAGGKLAEKFWLMDKNTDKTVSILLAAALFISAPSGVIYAARDLFGEFTPFKSAAEFIEENIPEDALIVTDSDSYSTILTYLPERRFYALDYDRFYTYCSHEKLPRDGTGALKEIVSGRDEIYYIRSVYSDLDLKTAVYFNKNTMDFILKNQTVVIVKLTPEEVLEMEDEIRTLLRESS